MSKENKSSAERREAEIKGALEALKRARLRAEEVALATGTMLIEWRDGKTVRVDPRTMAVEPSEDQETPS